MLVNCRNCNIEFEKKNAEVKRTKNHYCCKKCKGEYLAKENVKSFYGKAIKNGACLEWSGSLNKSGYGVVRYMGRQWLAHRASYVITNGEIGDGLCVCHKCDNPKCINPEHLFIGTHLDNMEDMRSKKRKWSKLTFEDVLEIRKSNESNSSLVSRYSVSERTIRYAKNAKNWMPLSEVQFNTKQEG